MIGTYCLAHGAYLASKQLHNELLENILHCPMSFFETTPMGRIVNRFSKDINAIDEKIPQSLRGFLGTFMDVLATIFAICYSTPLFLVVLLPLGVLYGITQVSFSIILNVVILLLSLEISTLDTCTFYIS